jgi:tRNA wybutosine-synthesizing protein 1
MKGKNGIVGKGNGSPEPKLPKSLAESMRKQGYHFVGRHSATKICAYASRSLKGGGTCYKHQFYGLRSWRCVQSTPALGCNLSCVFCWRTIPEEVGHKWNELNAVGEWDSPATIADGLVEEHKRIVTGYKGNDKVDMERWRESNDPAHIALSLTGEPLFYPKLNELLKEFKKRRLSTFLVTNGTMTGALKKLKALPTQLYVSVQAPNAEIYAMTVRPKGAGATWSNFLEFLKVFSKLKTRRAFRLTLVRGLNMTDAAGYASLVGVGKPHYVEVKGFVYVGGARNPKRGLEFDQMPKKDEIIEFAKAIATGTGYLFADYHESSNVALLCRDKKAYDNRIIKFLK